MEEAEGPIRTCKKVEQLDVIMPTLKQQKLAQGIVDAMQMDVMPTKAELLVSAGYSEVTAYASPSRQIELKGTQEALADLGFSEEAAKKVVAEILSSGQEEGARLKAADMIFKVHGTYAPIESKNLNVDVKVDVKDLSKHDALRMKYETELRASLLDEE